MKKLVIAAFAVLAICNVVGQTSELPILKNKICFTDVVKVDSNLTKSDLYGRAHEWFAKTYKSANDVLQLADEQNCVLVGKALFKVHYTADFPKWVKSKIVMERTKVSGGYVEYVLSLYFKDGKYKYEMTDFVHVGTGGSKTFGACENLLSGSQDQKIQSVMTDYILQIKDNAESLISSLYENLNKSTISQNDEW